MCAPHRCCLVSLACSIAVVLSAPSLQVRAQDDVQRSTIRLVSSTEAGPAENVSQSAAPVESRAAEEPAAEEPAEPAPVVEEPAESSAEPAAESESSVTPEAAPDDASPQVEAPRAHLPRTPVGLTPNSSSRNSFNQIQGPPPVQPSRTATRVPQNRRAGKPFQSLPSEPTISPYLYLNSSLNNGNMVTNYLAFVRPQLDAQDASRQQQHEIQQLRTQIQKMSSGGGGQPSSASMNSPARYMDTAQFYPGFQR